MRLATIASVLAIVVCAAVFGTILLRTSAFVQAPLPARAVPAGGQAPTQIIADAPATNAPDANASSPTAIAAQTPSPPGFPPVEAVSSCQGNPNALGISRVVEVDTTG